MVANGVNIPTSGWEWKQCTWQGWGTKAVLLAVVGIEAVYLAVVGNGGGVYLPVSANGGGVYLLVLGNGGNIPASGGQWRQCTWQRLLTKLCHLLGSFIVGHMDNKVR